MISDILDEIESSENKVDLPELRKLIDEDEENTTLEAKMAIALRDTFNEDDIRRSLSVRSAV